MTRLFAGKQEAVVEGLFAVRVDATRSWVSRISIPVVLIASSLVISLLLSIWGFEKTYGFFYDVGSEICHQLPDRSMFAQNRQLFLCARCTGVLFGLYAAFLAMLLSRTWAANFIEPWYVLLLIAPLLLDGLAGFLGVREGSNDVRFTTGLLFGVAILLCESCFLKGMSDDYVAIDRYFDSKSILVTLAAFFFILAMVKVMVTCVHCVSIWWALNYLLMVSLVFNAVMCCVLLMALLCSQFLHRNGHALTSS